jgi:Protein of unknown function (DUF2934)
MSVSGADEIQRIAYELWQIDGEPAGRDQEHWERAKRIFESRNASPGDTADGREAHGSDDTPRPVNPGFEEVAPGMVPQMKDDPVPDLPDPPMGRFASQLKDLPEG